MRIQHVAVMFVIIFIPIILVTSYFISLQVNSIRLESDYSDKLLKATYDAMTAFELNTANEDLSTVSDSLRSILDASTNIFFNTLCTNLGVSNASKSFVQPYIPAILYTMYDGYYIYSPTNIPEICTDKYGRTIRTSDYGVVSVSPVTVSGKTIGVYDFNQDAIKYDENTPTEPNPSESDCLDYSEFSSEIKQEYGQILYKNIDGTYSTELHTWDGANANKSTYYKRSYILKSYIPYSARYSGNTAGPGGDEHFDITMNYTLDNFLSVEGNIGNIYYTKSGYLTEKDLVTSIDIVNDSDHSADRTITDWRSVSEEDLIEKINNPEKFKVTIELNDGTKISNTDGNVDVESSPGVYSKFYWDDAQSAVEYYVKSYIFSNWFYDNLSDVEAGSLQNTQYTIAEVQNTITKSITNADGKPLQTKLEKEMLHNFVGDTTKPFRISTDTDKNNPESEESDFYEHKRDVIKNSITYNMILSMLVYTEDSSTNEFNMPVLQETEWDTILNNVSITAFMQGMNCGLKYFNSYAIVTSTNNEISVTDNEIYYVPRVVQDVDIDGDHVIDNHILANLEDSNYDSVIETAHRIDCDKLILGGDDNFSDPTTKSRDTWLGCISFKSKEIKYDKILNKDGSYTYDHKAYTDYNCIVDSNYVVKNVDDSIKDGNTDILTYLIENVNSSTVSDLKEQLKYKLLAYRIAIAKERNNLYKTTAFPENYGWQVVFNPNGMTTPVTDLVLEGLPESYDNFTIDTLTKKSINEISKIEVTIEYANNSSAGVYTDTINAQYNTGETYDEQTISTTSKSKRTLEFVKNFDTNSNVSSIKIFSTNHTRFYLHSIKFYYK